jgi:TrbC/VIRB2 pilin
MHASLLNKFNYNDLQRFFGLVVIFTLIALVLVEPAFAQAGDFKAKAETKAKDIFDIIFSVAYWAAGAILVVLLLIIASGRKSFGELWVPVIATALIFSVTLILDFAKA